MDDFLCKRLQEFEKTNRAMPAATAAAGVDETTANQQGGPSNSTADDEQAVESHGNGVKAHSTAVDENRDREQQTTETEPTQAEDNGRERSSGSAPGENDPPDFVFEAGGISASIEAAREDGEFQLQLEWMLVSSF